LAIVWGALALCVALQIINIIFEKRVFLTSKDSQSETLLLPTVKSNPVNPGFDFAFGKSKVLSSANLCPDQ
jgi:hypothetical protein